jgi:hypothetical protein
MSRKIRVYCAGPIRKGDLCENISQADDAFYRLMKTGIFAPMIPHWSCYAGDCQPAVGALGSVWARADGNAHFPDIPGDAYVEMDLAWVRVSEAVLRLPGESVGADLEVQCAKENGIPVFYTVEDVVSWGKEILKVEELQRVQSGWREAGSNG